MKIAVFLLMALAAMSYAKDKRTTCFERCSSSVNFTADLAGKPDSRPGETGASGETFVPLVFKAPPPGYRVRVLRVYGDFLIWIKGGVTNATAGALFSLAKSGSGDTSHLNIGDDDVFLYLQLATRGEPERAAYDHVVEDGGWLGEDNTLVAKVAVFLNETGQPVHMEPTFVMVYQWVKVPQVVKAPAPAKAPATPKR